MDSNRNVRRIAMLGNHPPRRCGIATYTHDVANALRRSNMKVDIIAMSDQAGYDYPADVLFEIAQENLSHYRCAAERINEGGYDLLSVQHEYGIFGGPAGGYLLSLLREVKMPIVTTLHTILSHPNHEQRMVLDEIIGLSQRLIVMSEKAAELLRSVHGVPDEKISRIHHGIPDLPSESPDTIKREMGLAGKKVVLTFGLLSPDKGIEYVIEAIAKIPDATYVVVGQTHPHIRRHSGETYRESLIAQAQKLGMSDRIRFVDRFVDDAELGRFLKMADLYVTPYLKEEQITSGTLAYTVGNGKAVVSTPYWHARELLADERGVLVPMRDAGALTEAIESLLDDDVRRAEMEHRAFEYGRSMRWPMVALDHRDCFDRAAAESNTLLKELTHEPPARKETMTFPEIRLNHLVSMTDDTGLYQHATYALPNREEGYCIDDNARALLFTVQIEGISHPDPRREALQNRYLAFCTHALNRSTGRFRNFMSFDRRWLEEAGSEDSHGRTLWCLGTVARRATDHSVRSMAREAFEAGSQAVMAFTSPRAWAYACLGYSQMDCRAEMREMLDRLMALFEATADDEWPWLEPAATYANARIPQALIVAGRTLSDPGAVSTGLQALSWLSDVQNQGGVFAPIGNDGFFKRGEVPAIFDQQPIEAASHVSACLTALAATGDLRWRREAERAFGWFFGRNILGLPVAIPEIGSCRDGLHPYGISENQGAESTLSYLMALAEMSAALVPSNRRTLA